MSERITSRANSAVRHIEKLCRDRKYRLDCGSFVCDGVLLLADAIKDGAEIETVIFAEGASLPDLPEGVRRIETSGRIIDAVSEVKTPQGVLCVCKRPETSLDPRKLEYGRHIILDGIKDPGNMGTIIRSADALGMDSVIVTEGSTDPFSPKAVRAAMGSAVRERIFESGAEVIINALQSAQIPIYAAANMDSAANLQDVSPCDAAIVIGSEAGGVSEVMMRASRTFLRIPIRDRTESLNAAIAASIIMWHFRRETTSSFE